MAGREEAEQRLQQIQAQLEESKSSRVDLESASSELLCQQESSRRGEAAVLISLFFFFF